MENCSKYAHSPAHLAVARRDYDALKLLISELPQLAKAGEVNTEAESIEAELVADAVSAVLDRRDVPGRETPLFLAVRLRDPTSVEYLMAAGADWSLQNENGWCALQEAVCAREESIAMIISRHYQPFAWAKWCRRLPRIVASAKRVRDFYMEITFHFESSMIPFIGRIAPSDTYRIWKRGSNLRADLTLAGFDGFHILRTDQSFLFLGDGYLSEDGKICLPKGSLVVLYHKEKEATSALEGAGAQPTEAEVAREVASMFRTNMYRSGIDVTQAELVPQLNWRRQERTEMVGNWKAKVYEMLHVMLHVKTRHVPGVTTGESIGNGSGNVDYSDGFTTEERLNLDSPREMLGNVKKGKERSSKKKKKKGGPSESKLESEFKKGLRPNLWLTPDFPLKIDELLPLLDILANKVKAVRRLRELLTTKLPPGTFPVKVAIPVVPTVRVLVTFTKFEELQPTKEFLTPPSSPRHFQDSRSRESEGSTSWVSWMKGNRGVQSSNGENRSRKDDIDPFHIPSDYSWIDVKEKKRRIKAMRAKSKSQETN